MPDNEIGTVIENQAYIFFDYNQPILTPLAFSTIWEEPPFLQTSIFEAENSLVTIYPNPATTAFYIDFSKIKQQTESAKIVVYDLFGRLVLEQNINKNLNKIDITTIKNGAYVYKIVSENAILGSGKIMIQGL